MAPPWSPSTSMPNPRNDIDAIRSTLISTPDGSRVALGTVAVLGAISLVAGWFPARTAARLNPVEALKM